MAYILGIEVDKIYIYPLGGISKLNMPRNISIFKELLILLLGPISQFIGYLLLLIIFDNELVKLYHYGILLFNLLPIYPLDGGKILFLLFNKIISYKKSLMIIINISYLITIILFLLETKMNISIIIMSLFLLILIRREDLKINYNYNIFLLERYLNNYNFKKSKIINNENNFYRDKKHILSINNNYYLESEYLEKKYKK